MALNRFTAMIAVDRPAVALEFHAARGDHGLFVAVAAGR